MTKVVIQGEGSDSESDIEIVEVVPTKHHIQPKGVVRNDPTVVVTECTNP